MASKAEDEKYLADLVAQCEQKSNDFASRQQLRAEELEAIMKAIEIISSPDVQSASQRRCPSARLGIPRVAPGPSKFARFRN